MKKDIKPISYFKTCKHRKTGDGLCDYVYSCYSCSYEDGCGHAGVPKRKASQNTKCFCCRHLKAIFLGIECDLEKEKTASADTPTVQK